MRYEDFVVREISREGEVVESNPDSSLTSELDSLRASTGKHARLVLAKENRDVSDAVAMLAKHLQVDVRKVSFHGLKDRRAVTYQHISIPWADLDRELLLSCMSATTWDPAVHISALTRQDSHCRVGWLRGNDFCIVVRDAKLAQGRKTSMPGGSFTKSSAEMAAFRSLIQEGANSLRSVGFVNYFGRQRFGPFTCSPKIGRAMASGQHEMACHQIVCSMREDF